MTRRFAFRPTAGFEASTAGSLTERGHDSCHKAGVDALDGLISGLGAINGLSHPNR